METTGKKRKRPKILSKDEISQIRDLYCYGYSVNELAKMFYVSQKPICKALKYTKEELEENDEEESL